ncbi:hypothetical protein BJ912DRAFT_843931 [Pholiota molesta]|nr:hypothetical protein BJ912DRAFT_843931 [Pholiota molesta]
MVNPGAFQGSRKDFLASQKTAYNAGVVGGYAADALAQIQRVFFKRYPIDLPYDQEPDAEVLATIDYEAPDVEQEEPDEVQMGPEEYADAMSALEERRSTIAFRKAQIKRWLAYQHMKDHDMDPKESGAHNPYRVLLHKLTGRTIQCPRLRTPVNKGGFAALRDKVAKELYAALDDEEKEEWKKQAQEEHKASVAAWKRNTDGSFSTDPADRQRCVYGLVNFVQPVLDLICEATGWKATFIAGGPEPAHGGCLNVISIHSGSTLGDVKMNFGRLERVRYKDTILPIYGQFLQKCYSPEECRERALSPADGFESMETMDLDGADFYSVNTETTAASESHAGPIVNSSATTTDHTSTTHTDAPDAAPGATERPQSLHGASPSPSPPPSPTFSPQGQATTNSTSTTRTDAHNAAPGAAERPQSLHGASPSPSPPPSPTFSPQRHDSRSSSRSPSRAPGPSHLPRPSTPSSTSSILRGDLPPSPDAARDAPAWFSRALVMLQCDDPDLGPSWKKLIHQWAAFEMKEAYGRDTVGKLKAKRRPAFVGDWIQRARAPSWRPADGRLDMAAVEGDWEPLRQPGINGLLSLVAGLFFWGSAARDAPTAGDAWSRFVDDCSLMFEGLLASI